MKQLIEEQEKQFEEISERQIFTINGKKGTLKNTIIYESLKDWHKKSLKQFINELIAREEGEFQDEHPVDCIDGVTPVETYGYEATYNQAKKETISHLKELKEQME